MYVQSLLTLARTILGASTLSPLGKCCLEERMLRATIIFKDANFFKEKERKKCQRLLKDGKEKIML